MTQLDTTSTPTTASPVATDVGSIVATLIAKVTARWGASQAQQLTPIIQKYGPTLATMGTDELYQWLMLVADGDPFTAYAAIVSKMDAQAATDEWSVLNAKWQAANVSNAAVAQAKHDAATALLGGLVKIALSLVAL